MPPNAYESEASTTAIVPATNHQRHGRLRRRVSTPTPTSPSENADQPHAATAARVGSSHGTSIALKIGTVEFATAAIARVDVLLAPRDQRERDRAVDDADREPVHPAARTSASAARKPCVATRNAAEEERREREPELHHRRRREVPDGDLDEEVRRAPDRGERADQEPYERVTRRTVPSEAPDTLAP